MSGGRISRGILIPWRVVARDGLLAKEKASTHARDALAAERRRLPMVKVEKRYVFEGPEVAPAR